MSSTTYDLKRFVDDPRAITGSPSDEHEIIRLVRPLARDLALARTWLEPRHYQCDAAQGFSLHLLHEKADHTLAVFAGAWMTARGQATRKS